MCSQRALTPRCSSPTACGQSSWSSSQTQEMTWFKATGSRQVSPSHGGKWYPYSSVTKPPFNHTVIWRHFCLDETHLEMMDTTLMVGTVKWPHLIPINMHRFLVSNWEWEWNGKMRWIFKYRGTPEEDHFFFWKSLNLTLGLLCTFQRQWMKHEGLKSVSGPAWLRSELQAPGWYKGDCVMFCQMKPDTCPSYILSKLQGEDDRHGPAPWLGRLICSFPLIPDALIR